MAFHSPLIRPAIYWGKRGFGGGTLDSHEKMIVSQVAIQCASRAKLQDHGRACLEAVDASG